MMKWLKYTFLLFSVTVVSQNTIDLSFVKKSPLSVSVISGIDNFGTIYYTNNNAFYKKTPEKTTSYSNIQLGAITSTNTFNPLKINLFYKDFNTVIILDNRLAEIFKIDFNNTEPYKNVSHISTGNDNTLWIFNQDLQKLELYDYKSKTTRVATIPVTSNVLDLKSDYNFCWLLTEKFLYKYNYFGSLLMKTPNSGYTAISVSNENVVLSSDISLYYLDKKSEKMTTIKTPELLIKQFLLNNETLYIYDSKVLHEFQLKTK